MASSIGTPTLDCGTRRAAARSRRDAIAPLAERRGNGTTMSNGEETAFGMGFACNYHKGLPHDVLGNVHCESYHKMVRMLSAGETGAFETLPVGANRSATNPSDTNPPQHSDYPGGARGYRKMTSPFTGHVFDTQGADAAAFAISPAPTIASAEFAAEMAELYGMALLRDVSFTDIASGAGPNVGAIATALGGMDFFQPGYTAKNSAERRRHETRGTIAGGQDLFRGSTPGSKHGHWVSQFLLAGNSNDGVTFQNFDGTPAPGNNPGPGFRGINSRVGQNDGFAFFGTQIVDQRSIVARPKVDYLTSWASWLDSQNGVDANGLDLFLGQRRYLTTPRDIATYVHYDALYQAYLVACLLMAADGNAFPKDRGMPESRSRTRAAFASFGGPHILSLVTEVATRALKAVWRQKWLHHRRMRPEVAAALVTLYADNPASIANEDLRGAVQKLHDAIPANILSLIAAHNTAQNAQSVITEKASLPAGFPTIADSKNYLLPMAFPEGSPTHPAYGAGHATVAGACVTVLKAFFEMYEADGETPRLWPWPVFDVDFREGPAPAGNQNEGGELRVISTPTVVAGLVTGNSGYTVQGELDKLAMNIANARNMAGVHYYTDYYESLRLGERIAVSILEEQLSLFPEQVSMRFTSFDGDRIRIGSNGDTASVQVYDKNGHRHHSESWYARYED